MSKHRAEAPPVAAHGFQRLIQVSRVSEAGLVHKIAAAAKDLANIAGYLHLVRVDGLSAEITLTRWRARGIRVSGKLKADIVQTCVVTLEPLPSHVEAAFERRFLPAESFPGTHQHSQEVVIDPEAEDPAEPLERELDLGEILIEELSLSLDPYPRKLDAAFRSSDEPPIEPRPNPFAKLAKLKLKPAKEG